LAQGPRPKSKFLLKIKVQFGGNSLLQDHEARNQVLGRCLHFP